ncbi:hypothetical protein Q5P01_000246 [Channa striata]|uniref:Uncharacterized protein n=1 Tax=Channa striata TaxID=64152 RepID=A0AA88IJ09_CHASR|nr:hypothetical protein Q5P01_000246 [Channa striata]
MRVGGSRRPSCAARGDRPPRSLTFVAWRMPCVRFIQTVADEETPGGVRRESEARQRRQRDTIAGTRRVPTGMGMEAYHRYLQAHRIFGLHPCLREDRSLRGRVLPPDAELLKISGLVRKAGVKTSEEAALPRVRRPGPGRGGPKNSCGRRSSRGRRRRASRRQRSCGEARPAPPASDTLHRNTDRVNPEENALRSTAAVIRRAHAIKCAVDVKKPGAAGRSLK